MSSGLIDIMKRAAMEAQENAQICDLRYGQVISTSPLRVKVTNLLTLPESLLVVPKHLTDYQVNVSIDWGTSAVENHSHGYSGTTGNSENHNHSFSGITEASGGHSHSMSGQKTMTIHNGLKVGDKVALLRKQGGQSYLILDRI